VATKRPKGMRKMTCQAARGLYIARNIQSWKNGFPQSVERHVILTVKNSPSFPENDVFFKWNIYSEVQKSAVPVHLELANLCNSRFSDEQPVGRIVYMYTGARAPPTYLPKLKKKFKMLPSTYVLHDTYYTLRFENFKKY